ncbi:hypothetical protein BVG19_g4696 [[Candida] boidinii]|nr:hypothetical protein BVG19_g4696 [[Candida] boidinii]OWB53344.1 hypothetical protein B5S27_g4938 [[Candida] boidinii]
MSEENIYDVDRNAEEAITTTNTIGINPNNRISTSEDDVKELTKLLTLMENQIKKITNADIKIGSQMMETMNRTRNPSQSFKAKARKLVSDFKKLQEENSTAMLLIELFWTIVVLYLSTPSVVLGFMKWKRKKTTDLENRFNICGAVALLGPILLFAWYCFRYYADRAHEANDLGNTVSTSGDDVNPNDNINTSGPDQDNTVSTSRDDVNPNDNINTSGADQDNTVSTSGDEVTKLLTLMQKEMKEMKNARVRKTQIKKQMIARVNKIINPSQSFKPKAKKFVSNFRKFEEEHSTSMLVIYVIWTIIVLALSTPRVVLGFIMWKAKETTNL